MHMLKCDCINMEAQCYLSINIWDVASVSKRQQFQCVHESKCLVECSHGNIVDNGAHKYSNDMQECSGH